nr:hypothetical protein [Anaeroplasmataceae bacterium]
IMSKLAELIHELSLQEQAQKESALEEVLIEYPEAAPEEEVLPEELEETVEEEILTESTEEMENIDNLYLDFNFYDSDHDSCDLDSQPDIELTLLEEQAEPMNLNEQQEELSNESYDAEFEPSDALPVEELSPKEQKKKAKKEKKEMKKKHKKEQEDVEEIWDAPAPTLFPIPEEKQIPPTFMEESQEPAPLSVQDDQPISTFAEEAQEPAPFMPLVPISPVRDCPVETSTPVELEDNPYFRSKKMNFRLKPILVSTLTVVLFASLFISIFAIIQAFR